MSGSILERNLAALGRGSRRTADKLRAAQPRGDAAFLDTEQGPTARLPDGRLLASARRPIDEGTRLADSIDITAAGVFVVLGFGLGHHVCALAQRLGRQGVVIVFEPDVELLRAVLERIDHSRAIADGNVAILTDADDAARMASTVKGIEALLVMGARIVDHPPSAGRLGELGARFASRFTEVVRAVRTNVATTLVQMERTIRNLCLNADRYAAAPGLDDLAGAGRGRPAIVVSAGPSLRRNLDLLARPGVRDQFVIVAVQTVLRTLLNKGIRPHMVTALDYHELSRRFYEGLTPERVAGVTLVCEPKANPAIMESFPGVIRCPGDATLDLLLGPAISPPRGRIPPGATVAHLAYYLARHLGCDPVILIGQDLGFTDHQYYGPEAAIHDVWAGELNEFNTLEMMEWQRVVRGRYTLPDGSSNLRRRTDHLGRSIYTDEQMSTYLVQFERDFAADAAKGLRVIDATEGGVAKASTIPMKLAEAIVKFGGGGGVVRWPDAPPTRDRDAIRAAVSARLGALCADAGRVAEHSDRAAELLGEARDHQGDQKHVTRLVHRLNELRDEVGAIDPAYPLVQQLNQRGSLNRMRADRAISTTHPDPMARQKAQIERDIENVREIAAQARRLGEILEQARLGVSTGDKPTREPVLAPGKPAPVRAWAIIPVDPKRTSLGAARDLASFGIAGLNPLRMTLLRLARCARLQGVILLTHEPEAVRALVGPAIPGLESAIVRTEGPALGARASGLRAGRAFAEGCWRGGLGTLTIFDEVLAPAAMARVMSERGIDAAVVLGPDWALVDPAITDAILERHAENPARHRVCYSQAAPGLAPVLVDRLAMSELARGSESAAPLVSIGGMLGYIPAHPRPDTLGKDNCVIVPHEVRDAGARCILEDRGRVAELADALEPLHGRLLDASAAEIAACLRARLARVTPVLPRELTIELCTGRRAGGERARWELPGEVIERRVMTASLAERIFAQLTPAGAARVTIGGVGEPMLHPELHRILRSARRAGLVTHLRTELRVDPDAARALLDPAHAPDIISVDLMADTPATYRAIMGADEHARVVANLEAMLERRAESEGHGGLPTPWIVPRLTRCDAVHDELEPFFDRWITRAGAAVIDPMPRRTLGERVEPLPPPALARAREVRTRMLVLSDARVPARADDRRGSVIVADLTRDELGVAWRRALRAAGEAPASEVEAA